MAKNLKINIKNTQIAKAINLGSLKDKLAKKKESAESKADAAKTVESKEAKRPVAPLVPAPAEEAPRIRARSKSAFAESPPSELKAKSIGEPPPAEERREEREASIVEETKVKEHGIKMKSSEELRQELFGEEIAEQTEQKKEDTRKIKAFTQPPALSETKQAEALLPEIEKPLMKEPTHHIKAGPPAPLEPVRPIVRESPAETIKLGPTGRHMRDLLPQKPKQRPEFPREGFRTAPKPQESPTKSIPEAVEKAKPKTKTRGDEISLAGEEDETKKGAKAAKFKEFRDIKPARRPDSQKSFDARDKHGLRESEDEARTWRKKRSVKPRYVPEDVTIRPTSLKVRIPLSIKDLAAEMKLKSSQLIQKLFLQGVVATLNDLLEDETTIQLLGQEFGCEISIDTDEEDRLRITGKSIKEEINSVEPTELRIRPPVVAFMGHVDHGKTSLIDAIRKSNRAAGEAGAITQHIGAFRCSTPVGDIAILDTPGHEAFSSMRARGADVTDIVVLVIAGDEGIRQQTIEAIQHAKQANVTIVVALNKCDKPNFNAENVYRQLADQDLLPESWGGQIITVNCSAVTGAGVQQLLEMLALQAEVLELKANPSSRARGTVLESEMHKGLGAVATVLVQNGTLRVNDALVFGDLWCRVKTMRDEYSRELSEAGPSTPVEITGLSGLPEAGQEFIVVKSEREAREIAEARRQGTKQFALQQKKKISMENLLQQAAEVSKKVLNIVLRADMQGSLEALTTALGKIKSNKAELNIIFAGVGEVTESDVQLAAASKAVIIGFHTAIESHADTLVKQYGVQVKLHDIIYHAIDDVKALMVVLLDKIALETDKGKAEVKALFKSSQLGIIAGCLVTEGSISRNHQIRVKRNNEVIWKGPVGSLKRVKEDVREVQKGLECGILLNGFSDLKEGDVLESYEITYITQEL